MEILSALFVIGLITLTGHGIWLLLAKIYRAIFSEPEAERAAGDERSAAQPPHKRHCTVFQLALPVNVVATDISVIVGSFLLLLATIYSLSLIGFSVGFDVWPMGEDRGWLAIMQSSKGTRLAQAFWQMNDRNPVSPWWYIAFRPIILGWDSGLLFVRYFMSLLCGISAYLCLRGVSGNDGRWFALAAGLLTAVFTANGYIDNIYWNFVGALSVTLLCIWAYTKFRDSAYLAYGWLSASLFLWFLAISSYTIQSGAVLAIGYLAYSAPMHGARDLLSHPVQRIRKAVGDALPFAGILLVFLAVWRTTSRPEMSGYYQVNFSLREAFRSLGLGVWHTDFPLLASWGTETLASPVGPVVFVLFAALIAAMLWFLLAREPVAEARVISPRGLFDVIVVGLCIAAPTVLLEASSSVWVPGTRWRMLHQLWVPLYATTVLFALYAGVLAARPSAIARLKVLWVVLVALASAYFAQVSLGHNRAQMRHTATERALFDTMAQVMSREPDVKHFVVRLEPDAAWMSTDALSSLYANTWFQNRGVTLRIIQSVPSPTPEWTSWWPVVFASDEVGIKNTNFGGGTTSYKSTRVVSLGRASARILTGSGKEEFKGFQVEWERNSPLP
jgi:hypothetical protein